MMKNGNKFQYKLTKPMVEHLKTWYNPSIRVDTMCLLEDLKRMGLKTSGQLSSLKWLHNRMSELGIRKRMGEDRSDN